MTLRSIQWVADSGLLVGLTTIGEFDAPPVMATPVPILDFSQPSDSALIAAIRSF